MSGMKAPEDLLRKIRQGNRFLLTSHANPDGDAIPSWPWPACCAGWAGFAVWNLDRWALPPAVAGGRGSTASRAPPGTRRSSRRRVLGARAERTGPRSTSGAELDPPHLGNNTRTKLGQPSAPAVGG
jgi:hypothetical protein